MPEYPKLLALLQSELDDTQRLFALMETEKQQLESRNLEALQQLLPDKAEILTAIENKHLQRGDWQQLAGVKHGDEALRDYLIEQQDVAASACLSIFDQLKKDLKNCSDYNTLNGLIISNSKRRNSQRLNIYRGKPQEKSLYNARGGSTSSSTRSRNAQQALVEITPISSTCRRNAKLAQLIATAPIKQLPTTAVQAQASATSPPAGLHPIVHPATYSAVPSHPAWPGSAAAPGLYPNRCR